MAKKMSDGKRAAVFGAGMFLPGAGFAGDQEGAMAGAQAGAALGSMIMPGWGTAAGAWVGSTVGGAFGFGGSGGDKAPQINIEEIMAQINAKIAAAGEMAKERVRYQAGQQRRSTASNMAARGVLRSGVSENVFQQGRDASLQAQAGIDEQVLTQQAGTFQDLFFKGKQLERADQQMERKRKAAQMGQLGALAGSLLNNRLQARKGATAPKLNPNSSQQSPGGSTRNFFSSLNLDGFGGNFQQQQASNQFEFKPGSNFGRFF